MSRMNALMVDSAEDALLVARAVEGDQASLRALVERHRPFVYNIAIRMFGSHADADDLTQEVIIRAITSLASFRGASSFRTWLYRIAFNAMLNTKRRGLEHEVTSFSEYFDQIAQVESDEEATEIGGEAIEELRLRCTAGMLMCLDREQRTVFILGAVFGVSHRVGAEILEITPANFRVRLHRARADLYAWMNRRCGLVNADNPCRCAKKTRGYVRLGLVDPRRLLFNADYTERIGDVVARDAAEAMDLVDDLHERVFRDQPLQVGKDTILDDVLGNEQVRRFFDLD
jgi:RNA polymerase sigma factor (sigma-70 family)